MKLSLIHNVQVLRFLAATLILLNHLLHEVVVLGLTPGRSRFAPFPWPIGVDIFFIISGFVMYLLARDAFGAPGAWKDFLIRRLARIVPPYWLFSTLMLAAAYFGDGAVENATFARAEIAASYAFIPWPSADGDLRPVLSLGWTLNYEIFFYAAFGAAMLHRRGIVFLAIAFVLLVLVASVIPERLFVLRFWGQPIILEFLFGIGLARLYWQGVRFRWTMAAAVGAAGVALAITGITANVPVLRSLGLGAPALLIASAFLLARDPHSIGRAAKMLQWGGDGSYALYLSHPFTIGIVALIWSKLDYGAPALFVLAGVGAAVLVGQLVHITVEKPLISAVRTRLARGIQRDAASVAP